MKTKKFENEVGCTAEFDERISDEIVKQRLEWLPGKEWKEIK